MFDNIMLHKSMRRGGDGNRREYAGGYSDRRSGQHTGSDDDIDGQGRQDDTAMVSYGDGKPCDPDVPDHAGGVER